MKEVKHTIRAERQETLAQIAGIISGLVKTTCGVANNAAWMACLEALGKVKEHPRYRKRAADGISIKKRFKDVVDQYHKYERNLLYGGPPYFFRLKDLPPDRRKSFGDITDSEYFDMWTAIGAQAYSRTRQFITCLVNKFKLSLESHGVKNADIIAWVITATTCLKIAVRVYGSALDNAGNTVGIAPSELNKIYKAFNMRVICELWMKAELAIEPSTDYDLDGVELKNIQLGIMQLEEQWMNTQTLYGSAVDIFKEYDDVWRTPGEQKKAINGLFDMMDACEKAEEEESRSSGKN